VLYFESMKKIDLAKIIEFRKLDPREVATELFPKHKHPMLALNRVLAGDGVLDADQISKFSLFTSIPIAELYVGQEWSSRIEGTTHVLKSGDFTAYLDSKSWTTKLFLHDSLFHEFILHSESITLSDYIQTLNDIISKYK
jgi:hypothetical protein